MQRLRRQVDRIDLRMLHLLQQRNKLSGEIGRMKRRRGAVVYVPDREHSLLARLVRLNKGRVPPRAVLALYREILSGSRAAQGQQPIGLLRSSAADVLCASHRAFGACDRFTSKKSWPELARGLRSGTLSLALLTGDDLRRVLTGRWRAEFVEHLFIAGRIPPAHEPESAFANDIFVITPRPATPPHKVSRLIILIECKSTQNAIKSLGRSMPELSSQIEPVRLSAKRDSAAALVCLHSRKPVDGARLAQHLSAAARTMRLSLSLLGSYLSPEAYAG